MRNIQKLLCLAIVGVCTLAASRSRAQGVEVDWDSLDGFVPSSITVNAGDEVDFVNMDDTFDLQITGDPPESFSGDAPPTDGFNLYYVPHVYNNPGVFSASDEFGNSVTITVNAIAPLAVLITDPASNAVFTAPATFTVSAIPSGGSGSYLDVEFLVGTNDVGDIGNSPYTTTVTNLTAGSYTISAIVTDSDFNTVSNSIPITVVGPPQLAVTAAGRKILVSWPTNNSTGFSLLSATNLPAGTNWNATTQTPALVGTNWVVTNSISGPRMFFRLSGP